MTRVTIEPFMPPPITLTSPLPSTDMLSQKVEKHETYWVGHDRDIQAPVLVAHGTRDPRVPFEHGKPHRWLPLEGVWHGFADDKQAQQFYPALFEFLDTHIGAKPASAEAVAASR